jgi:hypothetical protein
MNHHLVYCDRDKANIIVSNGSVSFEIIRDFVENLPIMIAPK